MKGPLTRSLFLAGLLFVLPAVPQAHAQNPQVQQMISSFNDWLVQARSPLDASHRQQDYQRAVALANAAQTAPWLAQFPQDRALITSYLQKVMYYVNYDSSHPYPPDLQKTLQDLANEMATMRTKLMALNGGREVLDSRNAPAASAPTTPVVNAPPVTPAGPAGGPGAGTGPGSLLGITPGAGPVPVNPQTPGTSTTQPGGSTTSVPQQQLQDLINRARAAGLQIVSMSTDPNNPSNVIVTMRLAGQPATGAPAQPGTGITPGGTPTGPTVNTTGSAASPNGTATTAGTVGRAGAKQTLANALGSLQSLLGDANLNNGAVVGADGSVVQPAKDSLSDIAGLLRELSGSYGADISAIIAQMQQLANANFGGQAATPQGFAAANNQVRQVRDQIIAKINALNAKIDSGQ